MGFFQKLFKSTTESGRKKLNGLEEVQENEYDVYGEIYDQCNTVLLILLMNKTLIHLMVLRLCTIYRICRQ